MQHICTYLWKKSVWKVFNQKISVYSEYCNHKTFSIRKVNSGTIRLLELSRILFNWRSLTNCSLFQIFQVSYYPIIKDVSWMIGTGVLVIDASKINEGLGQGRQVFLSYTSWEIINHVRSWPQYSLMAAIYFYLQSLTPPSSCTTASKYNTQCMLLIYPCLRMHLTFYA